MVPTHHGVAVDNAARGVCEGPPRRIPRGLPQEVGVCREGAGVVLRKPHNLCPSSSSEENHSLRGVRLWGEARVVDTACRARESVNRKFRNSASPLISLRDCPVGDRAVRVSVVGGIRGDEEVGDRAVGGCPPGLHGRHRTRKAVWRHTGQRVLSAMGVLRVKADFD